VSRQKLVQHFLASGPILDRIASAVCPQRCETVVEIGPGRGALTAKLLERSGRVVAIEIDGALAEQLRATFPASRLEVIHGDVLETDLSRWPGVPVAGNLPYYIASPTIEKVIRLRPPRAVFLVQKEVAERLTAQPGSRDYGFLTVQTAAFANARRLFDVKPGAFRPPPKVDSTVVLLEPRRRDLGVGDLDAFVRFVARCFRQKRKTLRNNLHDISGVENWPEAGSRAEQLGIEQFVTLFQRACE
jgi:16S rRNA (adenine1518-N6/adenine1519-N6)-dimethyltransferase